MKLKLPKLTKKSRSRPTLSESPEPGDKSLTTSAELRAVTMRPEAGNMRRSALYCTPHMKIPGVITVSPALLFFEPDSTHQHVQECGMDTYRVRIEVVDVVECGAVIMPVWAEGPSSSFFLQLQLRTLDGKQFRSREEEVEDAWFAVFQFPEREDLNQVATLILEATEDLKDAARPNRSTTTVPFPCLDCMAERERVDHHLQLQRQLSNEEDSPRSISASQRLAKRLGNFFGGSKKSSRPRTPKKPKEKDSPSAGAASGTTGSSVQVEKVILRLPEHCTRSTLTAELAECLLEFLPVSLRIPGAIEWVLRYSPKAHGVSIETMFRNLFMYEKTVVILQDTEDYLFGGFATNAWEPVGKFYGSGEAFVFSYGQVKDQQVPTEVQFFPWTSGNECFMYADRCIFGMGGGDGRHAFVVREDMLHGHSAKTQTFGNAPLAGQEDFVLRDVEVWSLEEA